MLEEDKHEVNELIKEYLQRPTTPENTQALASLYQVKALWGLTDDLCDTFIDEITTTIKTSLSTVSDCICDH